MSKLLRVAISAALLAVVAAKTDWNQVAASFALLRLEFWLAGAGLLIVAQVASAWRWKFYADELRLERTLGQLTSFYFIGMFFNLMLPTSVGGDVVRAWYVSGQSGRRLSAFASVFLDRLNGLLVLVALACLAVTFSPLELPAWIGVSVWGIAACGVLGVIGLQVFAKMGRLAPARMEQIATAVRLLRVPHILAGTLLLSTFVQAANVVIVWLVGQAIHAPIPPAYYWIMVPMVSLLTLLPISISGTGVREGAMCLFLAPLGVDQGTALTLAFLWFAVQVAVSLLGGLVYLFGRFPKPATPAQAPDEVIFETSQRDGVNGLSGDIVNGEAFPCEASAHELLGGEPVRGDSRKGREGQHRQAA